jgi:hypothetical protein
MMTPSQSGKNFAMTPAAQDLGLGDQIKQQLDDQEEERKKMLLQQAKQAGSNGAPLSQASQHLGFPAGSASQALLGGGY